ncbi:MAG: transporter substrate-binding domain-containing protein, partial [Oscillospiraceae bacterium]|nr:transporter substrate-binding domain-containing protein [Oscillospiraceae bacterium]
MFRKLLAGIMAFVLTLTVSGCGGVTRTDAPTSDGSLRRVLDAGRLVIGLDANYPPMGFTDEAGEIVGFDIDVAQE